MCGKRGDLLIWSQFTPHGSGRNTSNHCRMAQFLTMGIASPQSAAELEEASRVGEAARARRGYPTGMAEWAEQLLVEAPPHQQYPVARLTALGASWRVSRRGADSGQPCLHSTPVQYYTKNIFFEIRVATKKICM